MLTHIPEHPPEASPALAAAAPPLFVFSALLLVLLLASRFFLLPRWAQVTVDGKTFSVAELRVQSAALSANLLAAESDRQKALVPPPDPLLSPLLAAKNRGDQVLQAMDSLQDAASQSSPVAGAVSLRTLRALADGSLHVEGDVSLVSYSSMSVLAQFVSRLQALTGVKITDPPAYVREDGPSGPHSPFTLTLSLTE